MGAGLRGRHSGRLAAEAVKIWADGGMSSRTAAIHGSYPVPPYGSGILYFERDELTEMVREFDARGFQVCIHAQGNRAIETMLDTARGGEYRPRGNPLTSGVETTTGRWVRVAATASAWRWPDAGWPSATESAELYDFRLRRVCHLWRRRHDGGRIDEAASLAVGFGELCSFYDSNRVTIEGHTDLALATMSRHGSSGLWLERASGRRRQ